MGGDAVEDPFHDPGFAQYDVETAVPQFLSDPLEAHVTAAGLLHQHLAGHGIPEPQVEVHHGPHRTLEGQRVAEAVGVDPHGGMSPHQRIEDVRTAGADELLAVADADDLLLQRPVSGQVFQRHIPAVAPGAECKFTIPPANPTYRVNGC